MQVDRETLLAAVNAANYVVNPNHSIDIFTKVWLLEDHVLAFNANGMVLRVPVEGLPSIGGVEGKVLSDVLSFAQTEEVEITTSPDGEITVGDDESTVTLSVLDLTDTVKQVGQIPKFESSSYNEITHGDLLDNCQLDAMLQVAPVQYDTSPDFSALVVDAEGEAAKLYTSDRVTINRTTGLPLARAKVNGRFLFPFEYMKTFMRLWRWFDDAVISFDLTFAVMKSDNDWQLACRLLRSETNTNFEAACVSLFPKGKVEPKLLVEIPEGLDAMLKQALAIAKNSEDDRVQLTSNGDALTITGSGRGKNKFSATIPCAHPPVSVSVSCKRLLQTLPHVNKMRLFSNAVALRGKQKYWRFIAGRA